MEGFTPTNEERKSAALSSLATGDEIIHENSVLLPHSTEKSEQPDNLLRSGSHEAGGPPSEGVTQDDQLLQEMRDIAGSESLVGSLSTVEVAFQRISFLGSLSMCHNLLQLSLICTQTASLAGLEAVGHSLETLDVVGCGLSSMQTCFQSMVALRSLNLGEN